MKLTICARCIHVRKDGLCGFPSIRLVFFHDKKCIKFKEKEGEK